MKLRLKPKTMQTEQLYTCCWIYFLIVKQTLQPWCFLCPLQVTSIGKLFFIIMRVSLNLAHFVSHFFIFCKCSFCKNYQKGPFPTLWNYLWTNLWKLLCIKHITLKLVFSYIKTTTFSPNPTHFPTQIDFPFISLSSNYGLFLWRK